MDGSGLRVFTRAASQFGAVFEWRKGAVWVARVLLVAPWRSRAKLSVTCLREWNWWKGEEFGPTRFRGSSEERPVTSRTVLVSRSPLPTPLSPLVLGLFRVPSLSRPGSRALWSLQLFLRTCVKRGQVFIGG